jgi:hypothetical protein
MGGGEYLSNNANMAMGYEESFPLTPVFRACYKGG